MSSRWKSGLAFFFGASLFFLFFEDPEAVRMDVVGNKANGVRGWLRHWKCDRSACPDVRTGRRMVDAIVFTNC